MKYPSVWLRDNCRCTKVHFAKIWSVIETNTSSEHNKTKNAPNLFQIHSCSFLAVNHHNNKNWVPSILTHNLWLIFMGMKQKKSKWRTQKNPRTNPWNFGGNCSAFGNVEKLISFWVGHFEFKKKKKKKMFHPHEN